MRNAPEGHARIGGHFTRFLDRLVSLLAAPYRTSAASAALRRAKRAALTEARSAEAYRGS